MLEKLERVALRLATLLALVVEAPFVYWIQVQPLGPLGPEPSLLLYVGHRMSPTLPRSWLLGFLLSLVCYLSVILSPLAELQPKKLLHHRQTFLGIWY